MLSGKMEIPPMRNMLYFYSYSLSGVLVFHDNWGFVITNMFSVIMKYMELQLKFIDILYGFTVLCGSVFSDNITGNLADETNRKMKRS